LAFHVAVAVAASSFGTANKKTAGSKKAIVASDRRCRDADEALLLFVMGAQLDSPVQRQATRPHAIERKESLFA
jgi:hypothetical protein